MTDYPVQVPNPPLWAIQLGAMRCIPGEINNEILFLILGYAS